MSIALIALMPFIGALFPGLLIRSGRDVAALACGTATLIALIGLVIHAPAVLAGEVLTSRIEWVPQLGLAANFRLDGLGLLFGLLILGIGLLIIAYARAYLSDRDESGRFFTYLMLFQGAMMGIVLSDNILLLLIFWELTSLSSFLLIGFRKETEAGRRGARMALTVTGMGGLAMIAGMLLLGSIAGSYELSDILTQREAVQASPMYLPALLLILLGAFTKSAQFPFHFWLPHAMAAPTPVSAYLHSATMVKAGIFVMARLWPVLSGTPEWFWLVTGAGLVTMLLGAAVAVFRDDLKDLLAYSTVSHLGLITMLLGFGTREAAIAAVFHIINHATFKAALFMTAGIIDHETGTRSIARLGGLMRLMPIVFTIGTIAALSMAGVPPLNGFLSKELMLEEAAHTSFGGPHVLMVLATFAAMLSVCYSLRFIWQVFMGPKRTDYPLKPHDPGFGLWASPALLAVLVILIGLAPQVMAGWLVEASASAVTQEALHPHLALWHGVTPALMMSGIALIGGVILLALQPRLLAIRNSFRRPDAKTIFEALVNACVGLAQKLTDGLTNGSMARSLAAMTLMVVICGTWAFSSGQLSALDRPMLPIQPVALIGWFLVVVATVCLIFWHRNRVLSLIMVGIIGLIVSGCFVYLSAPDLALTQISVEVVTVILLLLALNFLPGHSPVESGDLRRGWHVFIATLAGLAIGGLSYAVLRSDFAFAPISGYMLANSHDLGGGDNVVNVILVDFRGYDTFGEITVLGIAALTIFALTETLIRGASLRRLADWISGRSRAGDQDPLMLVVASRIILPMSLMVAMFIFLRGHNQPGGGFVAGLIVSVALVLQYIGSGLVWTEARQRVPYHGLIGAGVLAAGITGLGAWFAGKPFLTSAFGYVKLPGLEEFELASAMGFDLGVFLCVVGAVMLALNSLSRIAQKARQSIASEGGL
ncbi:monovalent cation/H+ antiporter subunit A [Paracoccus sulfuroxidans]|uniref:Multisubunit potassium/proton antiporter, PhaA subunit (TC 2.A.63.1.1)/multisubunit potassium/proton antiporter, PhaB subunit (TC 2.A.63.1.1) n=1 Tax=Paracoccus sulfuroxidans TaxID=384678 RepID=A0A562NQD7_9RHOB|nr:monovalent cation/H+ antiporter subunit A [Paracoccus sulfuroxidans]TWI34402.1 multisubunit potassium/proton antiporter, PhaA subunit (TC 2.A.63.1.1)/multisubunit potassium/proton antiporter, PhaB subunit (TC 2.A.63.1.1) [Paracoccus sulfuroxidans]